MLLTSFCARERHFAVWSTEQSNRIALWWLSAEKAGCVVTRFSTQIFVTVLRDRFGYGHFSGDERNEITRPDTWPSILTSASNNKNTFQAVVAL